MLAAEGENLVEAQCNWEIAIKNNSASVL
jgi:hypothetical protein